MALVGVRSGFGRLVKAKLLSNINKDIVKVQTASLTGTFGEPYPYAKPYPYKTKWFTIAHEFFDKTLPRFNENTKIIIVEGTIGVGKAEFAQRLAKNFDLLYVPQTAHNAPYYMNGLDQRSLNEWLPKTSHFYGLEEFLQDPHPERGTFGRHILLYHTEQCKVYSNMLRHLFHTGQGAVVVGSPFSSPSFSTAAANCGYITRNFEKYFKFVWENSICELLKPHILINLEAPAETCMQRIKQSGKSRELEAKSKVINEKFISMVNTVQKQELLSRMRKTGEVLEVDWSEVGDDVDLDAISEEMMTLDLEPINKEDPKFNDWADITEDTASYYRRYFGQKEVLMNMFQMETPRDCNEILYSSDDYDTFKTIVFEHPAIKYQNGWAPPLGFNGFYKSR